MLPRNRTLNPWFVTFLSFLTIRNFDGEKFILVFMKDQNLIYKVENFAYLISKPVIYTNFIIRALNPISKNK